MMSDERATLLKFSPDQGRDDHGRFTSGGGTGGSTSSADQRAAESAAALKHELKLLATGVALKAAVAIGAALAPKAAATAVGTFVVTQATRQANDMFQRAGFSAANQILKGMGVDTSKAEAVARKLNAIFKAAGDDGEAELLAALRAPLFGVADQAAAALTDELRADNPQSPRLADALKGVNAALAEYKEKLGGLGKSAVPAFATYAERQQWEASEFAGVAVDLGKLAEVADDTRGVLQKAGAGEALTDKLAEIGIEALSLALRLDRLASQPLPLPLQSMTMAGTA